MVEGEVRAWLGLGLGLGLGWERCVHGSTHLRAFNRGEVRARVSKDELSGTVAVRCLVQKRGKLVMREVVMRVISHGRRGSP